MPQHVTVSDYDPAWLEAYARERKAITGILGDNCLAIYHIGSTSVPGLPAKPIIDIMAAVRSLEQVDEAAGAFAGIGYEFCGEFGIPGRRYLRKGGDERTHQLHIFQAGDWNNIGRHLAFRDFMRSHEKEREEYGALKKDLARRFPYDIGSYCDGKDAFVRSMEEKALSCIDDSWDRLYLAAREVQYERKLSPPFGGRRGFSGTPDGQRKSVYRRLHRYRLLPGHVRGKERHCPYDHSGGEPHRKAGCDYEGWNGGDALRGLPGADDAAWRRSRRHGDPV